MTTKTATTTATAATSMATTAAAATAATGCSHTALPALVRPSPPFAKRGHIRSSSLENAHSFNSKNTLGLPVLQPGHTGTLKSRNEQKRLRNKFGSHSNLEDYVPQGRTKFQNIRQMFEFSKKTAATASQDEKQQALLLQSLPATVNAVTTTATAASYQQQAQPQLRTHAYATQQQQLQTAYQQQFVAQQQQQQPPRKPKPAATAAMSTGTPGGSGSRCSLAEINERFSIAESLDGSNRTSAPLQMRAQQPQLQRQLSQPPQQQHQQMMQQHLMQPTAAQQQHQQQQQQQQRSASGLAHLQHDAESADQATNLLRPIAFKPIPFEPDYSIPSRYCDVAVVDRYGSTPSLAPVQGSNLRFGSTTDLRHAGGVGGGVGCGGGFVGGAAIIGGYSSSNYCNSLMARRRGSRSLKINDSMESIRHTPDSDANSQSSTIKSNCSNSNANGLGNIIGNGNGNGNSNNKYMLSEQCCDMTPSPSDSGISELEAALKDRDSELSYLRQTMEHNEKVIFKVQKDKETFWEGETKRLKCFYEGQQREYLLKMKKMEQMLAMQQFQLKQHKLRHSEQSNKLREQVSDLKNENEILRSNNSSLKNSERNLKDRTAYNEEQLREAQIEIDSLKTQLEESEWRVCERNGEIALLKTQLKEANVEITLKEHALVHLKHENTNAETQIYQSLQEHQQQQQQQRQADEQKARSQRETDTELKQLNKIIILKDQVILALTNELGKLRKELSDLAIFQEYGEEPSGKYMRLKQQLDNLTDICNKTRKHAQKSTMTSATEISAEPKEKVIDDTNLEVIMNCLKMAPPLDDSEDERELAQLSAEKRLAKMSADIQKFVYGSQNLPDVAVSVQPAKYAASHKLEESTLDTLIEESANYAEEIAHLRKQLDDVRVNFELEKRQWSEEKGKVLSYQKQLQTHYINMYQKLRSLESCSELV